MTSSTTTRMLRFLTGIFLVWSVSTSDGASVGVVRLDGEAAPQLEQHAGTENADSLSFLTQYGYLPRSESGKSFLITHSGLSSALKQMQKFGGLEQTGVLDEATLKLIKTPRCGVPDLIDGVAEDEDVLDSLTIVDVVEEDAETFNGHGNGEEDFWDHVMENLTDNVTEDASREIEVKETVGLQEDDEGKSVIIDEN